MTTRLKKILVVDDNEAIREVMKMGLIKLGYDPAFAENGNEALEILAKGNFPLILLDIRLFPAVEAPKQQNGKRLEWILEGRFASTVSG